MTTLRALQRYVRMEPRAKQTVGERCELCGGAIAAEHAHVVDLDRRAICCACRPCALLFYDTRAAGGRYRTVPDRVLVDPAFTLTDAEWSKLEVPVRLSFVFRNSRLDRWIAVYPSPAGATESVIAPEAWDALSSRSELLRHIDADVEALLVRGARGQSTFECFVAPIDACYELVARIRKHWKGFDGGDAVRESIDSFFAHIRERSRPFTQSERKSP